MSAFYDQASLVVVPSGYKSGKIYAQKPLTTDGQLTFTRASTATRVNASGLIETVSSGVPRLDYTNSSCPKILLEPQRSNIAIQSNSIGTLPWILADVTVTTNGAVSPDGTQDADILTEGTGNAQHRAYQTLVAPSASVYTLSVYIKNVSGTRRAYIDGGPWGCYFNFSTQAIQTFGTGTASAQSVGNGWYRLVMTGTASYTPSQIFVGLASTSETYTGDGTSAIAFWNVQFEAGAYATSAIKTTSAAVTRVADAASKTGISSLIGQTEGTLFSEVSIPTNADGSRTIAIQGGSDRIGISVDGSAVGLFIVTSAGVVYNNAAAITWLATNKIAAAYKNGSTVVYVNGTAVLTTSNTFTLGGAMANVYLGQYEFSPGSGMNGQRQAQALLFKTRLTNAQLAELTTL